MGDAATEKHDEEDLAAGVSLYSKLQEKKYKLLVKQEDIEFAKAGLKDEIVELEAKHSQLDIVKGRVKDCIDELALPLQSLLVLWPSSGRNRAELGASPYAR